MCTLLKTDQVRPLNIKVKLQIIKMAGDNLGKMDSPVKEEIFRTYDIRGYVEEDFTPDTVYTIGIAYSRMLWEDGKVKYRKIAVGRDVRSSSEELASSLSKALIHNGLDVIDLGVCTTPALYYACHTMQVDGGIMITGSHNPPEYNGMKICVGKETIFGEDIQRLRRIIEEELTPPRKETLSSAEGNLEEYLIIPDYRNYLEGKFSFMKELNQELQSRRGSPLSVCVDAGNGTVGLVLPQLLNNLGFEVHPLYTKPDPSFPNHHPDPTELDNLQDLIEEVTSKGLECGLSFDGDGDRLGVVDEKGEVIWGDRLMLLYARDILEEMKGEEKPTFIGEVKCSQILYDKISELGGRPIMWKTGHSLIKKKMKEEGAVLAGEMSGHLFFADRYFGYDDAVYAGMRLLEILLKKGTYLSHLLSDLPTSFITPEIRVECPEEKKFKLIEELRDEVEKQRDSLPFNVRDVITIDGLRIVFEQGWGLVRASNTQPMLVMRFEAESKELLQDYRDWLMSEVEKK